MNAAMVTDGIFLLLFFLVCIDGYRKGFVRMIARMVAMVAAMFAARYLAGMAAPSVGEHCIVPLLNKIQTGSEVSDAILHKSLETMAQDIAYGVAFVILFAILQIVFVYVAGLFGFINEIPVIGTLNRIAGGFLGVLWFFMLAFVLAVIVFGLLPVEVRESMGITDVLIKNSRVLQFLNGVVQGIQIK